MCQNLKGKSMPQTACPRVASALTSPSRVSRFICWPLSTSQTLTLNTVFQSGDLDSDLRSYLRLRADGL